jgi:hypothetical protein
LTGTDGRLSLSRQRRKENKGFGVRRQAFPRFSRG